MKLKGILLVVTDIEKAKNFYQNVLGLQVTSDLGANVILTGGVSLQTKETWKDFTKKEEEQIRFGGNNAEIYFEEDQFDLFIEKLSKMKQIEYVHNVIEHSWGQRVVRFYDLDHHIIEVGETIKMVIKRFLEKGLTMDETAKRMDVPIKFIQSYIK